MREHRRDWDCRERRGESGRRQRAGEGGRVERERRPQGRGGYGRPSRREMRRMATLDTGRSPIYDDMDLQTVRRIGTHKIH